MKLFCGLGMQKTTNLNISVLRKSLIFAVNLFDLFVSGSAFKPFTYYFGCWFELLLGGLQEVIEFCFFWGFRSQEEYVVDMTLSHDYNDKTSFYDPQ